MPAIRPHRILFRPTDQNCKFAMGRKLMAFFAMWFTVNGVPSLSPQNNEIPSWLSGTSNIVRASEDSSPNKPFESPEDLIKAQVPEARRRIEEFHAEELGKSNRTMHIVYWTPADREPAPEYRERLTRVLRHVQEFYAKEMDRLGFGRLTFGLEQDTDGLVKIHLVKGSGNYDRYNVQSGGDIRRESLPILAKAGIKADEETIVIFCNMSNWDPQTGKISQNSPYYAGGGLEGGTAWQVDSPILDSDKLSEKTVLVSDGQYGRISLGKYNSIFVGGVCHELGHALGLPHNRQRDDEGKAFGTALMGSGNRTYGDELRGEGRGSFLTLGEGLRLAAHPLFLKSDKGLRTRRQASIENVKIEPAQDGKSFTVTGRVKSSPNCYAIVAYMDPAGGSDYDATTMTTIPDSQGNFSLQCSALKPGSAAELRLIACTVAGGSISDQKLAVPYSVSPDGIVDLSKYQTTAELRPIVEALDSNDLNKAKVAYGQLRRQKKTSSTTLSIAEAMIAGATPPQLSPAETRRPEIQLSNTKPLSVKLGYGRPFYNRLPEGRGALSAGNELFAHGIYAHAPSEHVYELGKRYKSLRGKVAIADGRSGTCVFVIKVDGNETWRSPTLKEGLAFDFNVNVEKAEKLELIVEDAGDGRGSDWGLWLEPILSR